MSVGLLGAKADAAFENVPLRIREDAPQIGVADTEAALEQEEKADILKGRLLPHIYSP